MPIIYTSDCNTCSAMGVESFKLMSENRKRRAIQHDRHNGGIDLEEIHTLGWSITGYTKNIDDAVRFVAEGVMP